MVHVQQVRVIIGLELRELGSIGLAADEPGEISIPASK
jgi:hypothetical protein